jgi:hypothetical protein
MFDLSAYSLAIVVHLAAATVLVGGSVFSLHVRHAMLEASSVGALRTWLAFARRSSAANPVAALALLGTGIYLGSHGWWAYGWFYVALAAWLVNSLLAARVLKPAAIAVATVMAGMPDDAPIDERVDTLRRSRGWRLAGATMLASDVAMLGLMVLKPSLPGSLALVLGGVFLAGGITVSRRRGTRDAGVREGHRPRYNAARDDERATAGV